MVKSNPTFCCFFVRKCTQGWNEMWTLHGNWTCERRKKGAVWNPNKNLWLWDLPVHENENTFNHFQNLEIYVVWGFWKWKLFWYWIRSQCGSVHHYTFLLCTSVAWACRPTLRWDIGMGNSFSAGCWCIYKAWRPFPGIHSGSNKGAGQRRGRVASCDQNVSTNRMSRGHDHKTTGHHDWMS